MAKITICKEDISDALIERPISFRFKGKRYKIYPLSLGKMQLCSRLMETLGFDKIRNSRNLTDLSVFIMASAKNNRDTCARLLAYATLPGDGCLDETKVRKHIRSFRKMEPEDISSIIIMLLSMDKTNVIKQEFGIDKEEERMSKIIKAKKDGNDGSSVTFGGKSIWGTIIDTACERYGWTYQYVLWGISFSALQLMMSDHVKTVILSKDERKSARVHDDGNVIRANDKEALRNYINSQNWE